MLTSLSLLTGDGSGADGASGPGLAAPPSSVVTQGRVWLGCCRRRHQRRRLLKKVKKKLPTVLESGTFAREWRGRRRNGVGEQVEP